MIKFFKKLFAWLFTKRDKVLIQDTDHNVSKRFAEQFEKETAEESPLQKYKKPEPLPGKKKGPVEHKIKPTLSDYFTMPRSFSFPRSKRTQMITWWDGQYFPGRWRTKFINH